MLKTWLYPVALILVLSALASACEPVGDSDAIDGTNNTSDATSSGTDEDSNTNTNTTSGTDATTSGTDPDTDPDTTTISGAGLSFEATFGANRLSAWAPTNNWRTFIDLAIFTNAGEGDSPLVVMLCETSDATCEDPIHVQQVKNDTEWESQSSGLVPIQNGFGPTITVGGLPAGDYNLMVFLDNSRTRAVGLGWDDNFTTKETAWGGIVSELDLMMSSDDTPAQWEPLSPQPLSVTLAEGKVTDIGTITLKHVHERDVSPDFKPETAYAVAATLTGVRIVDLSTAPPSIVSESAGNFTAYEFQPTDANGDAYAESICGMINGPGNTVFLLYGSFAVQFDIVTRQALHGSNVINLPALPSVASRPCRGIYHEADGKGYLFLTNAESNTGSIALEGLWYARTDLLADGNVDAGILDRATDELLRAGLDNLAAHDNTLYATVSPSTADNTSIFAPDPMRERHNILIAPFNLDTGLPDLLNGGAGLTSWQGPLIVDEYDNGNDTISCELTEPGSFAGLSLVPFHDGRNLLFLGGCTQISIFDIADGSQLDFNPVVAGRQGFDGTFFGHGFRSFSLSPDGDTLWALPSLKSSIHLFLRKSDDTRVTGDRHMALPIDLSSGSVPSLDPAFNTKNIDQHDGDVAIGNGDPKTSPAADPGIDLRHGAYHMYHLGLIESLQGVGFQSATAPTSPSLLATNNHLLMRGAGIEGVSGLGKASDIAIYDLTSTQAILFPHDDHPFYRYWLNGGVSDLDRARFGLDLTPPNAAEMEIRGLVYKTK